MTFLLSFYVITLFWFDHDRLFSRVKRLTPVLAFMNFCWMLTIILIPVAAASKFVLPLDVEDGLPYPTAYPS